MPYKEKEIEKLYYTISEVASMFDVNSSLIRFWEKEFDILKPKKNKKGNRLFTKEDIKNLKLIYHLVKEKGYTLQGAKDKLKEKGGEVSEKQLEVVSKLEEIRNSLLELQEIIETAPETTSTPMAAKANGSVKAVKAVEPAPKPSFEPPNDISPNQISLFD